MVESTWMSVVTLKYTKEGWGKKSSQTQCTFKFLNGDSFSKWKGSLQKDPKQLTEGLFTHKRDLESCHIRIFLLGTLIGNFNTQLPINQLINFEIFISTNRICSKFQ
jgi:hypothetical protein